MNFVDQNGETDFIDQNGVTLFVDQNGVFLGTGETLVMVDDLVLVAGGFEEYDQFGVHKVTRSKRKPGKPQ